MWTCMVFLIAISVSFLIVLAFAKILGEGTKQDEEIHNMLFFTDGTPRRDFKWIRIF